MKHSKITFIDLAGSERAKKTKASGLILQEATFINSSLSSLGNVIGAMATGQKHIPYRDSKLTLLLKSHFQNQGKTLILSCVSSMPSDFNETSLTLLFTQRARRIKPKIISGPKKSSRPEVARLQAEVDELRNGVLSERTQMQELVLENSALQEQLIEMRRDLARKDEELKNQKEQNSTLMSQLSYGSVSFEMSWMSCPDPHNRSLATRSLSGLENPSFNTQNQAGQEKGFIMSWLNHCTI